MLTFEEAQEALDEIAFELPEEIFTNLNGGYALIPDIITDSNGLLVLGRYNFEPRGLGRYITIHYGSIRAAYGWVNPEEFRGKLKHVLHHELTHHLEHLAGDRSLEIQDEIDKARYLNRD